MKTKIITMNQPQPPALESAPTRDQIAARARRIWEQEGKPEGRDVAHWLQAEAQLRQNPRPRAAA